LWGWTAPPSVSVRTARLRQKIEKKGHAPVHLSSFAADVRVFRSAAIPFDFHLPFAFKLVDKAIHLLAVKVGDLLLSRSFGSRLIHGRERQTHQKQRSGPNSREVPYHCFSYTIASNRQVLLTGLALVTESVVIQMLLLGTPAPQVVLGKFKEIFDIIRLPRLEILNSLSQGRFVAIELDQRIPCKAWRAMESTTARTLT